MDPEPWKSARDLSLFPFEDIAERASGSHLRLDADVWTARWSP